MKKIIILTLLLVSVIGCIDQKAEQPLQTAIPAPEITDTVTKVITTPVPQDTVREITVNSTPEINDTIPNVLTTPIISPEPTQDITGGDTGGNSSDGDGLDNETVYDDNNEPPDEGSVCYDENGADIPCPPDDNTTI